MCGIVGIFGLKSNLDIKKESITKMTSTLIHRGPDGWGTYCSNDIALGHTRLSIIDINGGHQPMITERYVISYNGEIYNYLELREELISKGCQFQTSCDTEVVIKSFEIYGKNALKKFNGQFAILLWDKRKKELIVARDRYGIRPLYVLNHNSVYYFSSEMKAFDTISNFHRNFDMQQLYYHSSLWNTLGDKTVYNNIRSIPSGTYEIYNTMGGNNSFRYYEIGNSNNVSPASFNEALNEFSELLGDAVKLRLRSDVPVANYLSGGIDSSVITYLTSKYNSNTFKTFSITFDDSDFDESTFQREMVQRINSEHFEEKINYNSINDNLINAVYHFERPVFRTAPIPLYLLSKAVSQNNIKVVLTGEAADEILFGYDSFKELKLLQFWKKIPDSKIRPLLIKKLYPHLKHYADPKRFGLMKMYYEGFLGSFENDLVGLNIRSNNNKIVSNFMHKDHDFPIDSEEIMHEVQNILPENFSSWSLLQKNQFLEMKTLLSGYLLSSQGDRMSMANGVEGRYPFLDHRLIEKLFYYKDDFKLKGFSQKHLLREAYKNKIPSSIVSRPKMPYQAPDLKSFFRNKRLTEQSSYFLSEKMLKETNIFDPKMTTRFINKFTRKMPTQIGYRDNMLITFILSTQMCHHWIKNPKTHVLDMNKRNVDIIEK